MTPRKPKLPKSQPKGNDLPRLNKEFSNQKSLMKSRMKVGSVFMNVYGKVESNFRT